MYSRSLAVSLLLLTMQSSLAGQPPLPASFSITVGADSFAPGEPAPALHGTYSMSGNGSMWTGSNGPVTLTVTSGGSAWNLAIRVNGALWGGNTPLTTNGGVIKWRIGAIKGQGSVMAIKP